MLLVFIKDCSPLFLPISIKKTKLGSEFSNFLNILFGISQESILRPVSIIFIADLFFINNDIDFVS